MTAIPRFGEPEEIANAVLFFVKKESSYITGAILDVDGGFSGYEPYRTIRIETGGKNRNG
jgi:NAD(P)-dependent dehydrogenase (short-subunit alcohol dehydrogenase family)